MNLLTRKEFKSQVFERDKNRCVICLAPAIDAHHIIERQLFADGGYYIDNGVSVCEKHHLLAEQTVISCEELRTAAKIEAIILPGSLWYSKDHSYDKWGNKISPDGKRIKGPLFSHCEPLLRQANLLHLFY